ncbi:MAG TPA: AI-2E family transporter, partial [Terrimicrobiaceae bacterium]|nr:AI-2E family transporter [Terrimicrobiaceae bacterium]
MNSPLPANPVARSLLVLVLAAGVYFFHGFLVPVLAALTIGFASWPLYRRLVQACGGRTALAASIALTIVLLVLVIPLSLALSYAANEISTWVAWLLEANRQGVPVPESVSTMPFVGQWLAENWQRYLGEPKALGEVIQFLIGEHVGNISRWVLATGREAFNILLSVLFIMITLFFVYKDGTVMVEQLDRVGERILPLRWQRFSRVVPATVSSTVMGMTLIAIGEGIVLGLAYKIAGVPSAFLLGVLTGFMAMVPGGAPLSVTLVSLYLIASGRPIAGIALFAWGAIELFIVDKTLRPKLVGGPIRLPFLPTLFGLIGGVKTMGMVGLFVGPVLMALLVAIWREWVLTAESEAALEAERENAPETEHEVVAPPSGVPSRAPAWSTAEAREMPSPQRLAEGRTRRPDDVLPASSRSL